MGSSLCSFAVQEHVVSVYIEVLPLGSVFCKKLNVHTHAWRHNLFPCIQFHYSLYVHFLRHGLTIYFEGIVHVHLTMHIKESEEKEA